MEYINQVLEVIESVKQLYPVVIKNPNKWYLISSYIAELEGRIDPMKYAELLSLIDELKMVS